MDWSKFKAFAHEKNICDVKMKFVSERIEIILGKGENAGNQHFLLFPKCFQKPPSQELLKFGIVRLRFNPLPDDKFLDSSVSKQIADDIFLCI